MRGCRAARDGGRRRLIRPARWPRRRGSRCRLMRRQKRSASRGRSSTSTSPASCVGFGAAGGSSSASASSSGGLTRPASGCCRDDTRSGSRCSSARPHGHTLCGTARHARASNVGARLPGKDADTRPGSGDATRRWQSALDGRAGLVRGDLHRLPLRHQIGSAHQPPSLTISQTIRVSGAPITMHHKTVTTMTEMIPSASRCAGLCLTPPSSPAGTPGVCRTPRRPWPLFTESRGERRARTRPVPERSPGAFLAVDVVQLVEDRPLGQGDHRRRRVSACTSQARRRDGRMRDLERRPEREPFCARRGRPLG